MNKIGVIGAGVIGMGVAQSFAMNGYEVYLNDINKKQLEESKKSITMNLRFIKMMKKAEMQGSIDDVVNRIHFTSNLIDLEPCKYIIENIVEDLNSKIKLYKELRNQHKEDRLYIVNTSCIPIEEIADVMEDKSKVIGIHFMNPVPMKDTVEVIKSKYTSNNCEEEVISLLKSINKEGLIVNDSPGFVSNRISHLYMNEAAYIVLEGVADAATVDDIFKKCFGHKMGPLETADLIGIDTVVNSIKVLGNYFKGEKFKCCPLLIRMVEEGKLGRKSGEGFYIY